MALDILAYMSYGLLEETDAGASCDYPAEADVLTGVEYANGTMTGTFGEDGTEDGSMFDLVSRMVLLLKSRALITATVGAHVYDTDLPRGENATPVGIPAIVVRMAPNSEYFADSPTANVAFELLCFGKNPAAARTVERALYDTFARTLTNVTVAGTRWISVWIDQTHQPKQDEITNWEFALLQLRAIVCTV